MNPTDEPADAAHIAAPAGDVGSVGGAGDTGTQDRPVFPLKRFGQLGYDRREVDEFTTWVALAVGAPAQTTVSAQRVDAQRFSSRRFGRGYAMSPVDNYLEQARDRIAASARSRGGSGATVAGATVAGAAGPSPAGSAGESPASAPRRRRVWPVYAVAAALVVFIVVFTWTQLR